MDYALLDDDVVKYQAYLEGAGVSYHGPYGDDKAPAKQIYPKAETAAPHLLPFIVSYANRAGHVKLDAAATTHGAAVTGFADIQIVAKDVAKATEQYKKLLGLEPIEAHGASARFQSGPGTITITDAWSDELKTQLTTKGEGVYKLVLKTTR